MKNAKKHLIIMLCFLLCFGFNVPCLSVYADTDLSYEYSFIGKTMDDIDDFVSFIYNGAYPSSIDITGKGLTLYKQFSGADYGVNAGVEVAFKRPVEEYNDATRSKSYQDKFKGKYKITLPLSFAQKERLSLTRLLVGSPDGNGSPAFIRTAYRYSLFRYSDARKKWHGNGHRATQKE